MATENMAAATLGADTSTTLTIMRKVASTVDIAETADMVSTVAVTVDQVDTADIAADMAATAAMEVDIAAQVGTAVAIIVVQVGTVVTAAMAAARALVDTAAVIMAARLVIIRSHLTMQVSNHNMNHHQGEVSALAKVRQLRPRARPVDSVTAVRRVEPAPEVHQVALMTSLVAALARVPDPVQDQVLAQALAQDPGLVGSSALEVAVAPAVPNTARADTKDQAATRGLVDQAMVLAMALAWDLATRLARRVAKQVAQSVVTTASSPRSTVLD